MLEEKDLLKVGDRVLITTPYGFGEEGVIYQLPGMAEYDRRRYLAAKEGCRVQFDDGVITWFFQKNLKVLPPREPDWKI